MEEHINKIALVTGANKGIGLAIARQLGAKGVTVIVGARDAGRGQAAVDLLRSENLNAHFVQFDVTDAGSITQAALTIRAQHGRLDILINNAGMSDAADGAPSEASIDAARRLFETIFLARWR
jgi:NAD(P)-dependent dehydrogenase (short-subunit alcohol dehydrogenase family)